MSNLIRVEESLWKFFLLIFVLCSFSFFQYIDWKNTLLWDSIWKFFVLFRVNFHRDGQSRHNATYLTTVGYSKCLHVYVCICIYEVSCQLLSPWHTGYQIHLLLKVLTKSLCNRWDWEALLQPHRSWDRDISNIIAQSPIQSLKCYKHE